MLLSDARSRIRTLVDDLDTERYSDAEIDTALASAQYEALLWAVAKGSGLFTVEATVTTSAAGAADLTALKPLKIVTVAALSGTTRQRLSPIGVHDISSPVSGQRSLLISYVARPTFPASASAAFVWGSGTVCPPVDSYMCILAASELKITEGEELSGLERRKAELQDSLNRLINIPGFAVMPMGRRCRSDMQWAATGIDTIQLAR